MNQIDVDSAYLNSKTIEDVAFVVGGVYPPLFRDCTLNFPFTPSRIDHPIGHIDKNEVGVRRRTVL